MDMIYAYIRKSARTAGLTAVLLAVVFALPTQHLKVVALAVIGLGYPVWWRSQP
jgi:hypothetical protein